MSKAKHSVYESGKNTHHHSEDALFEAMFGLSWGNIEMDAKLKTVGTAVSEGAEKLEVFMKQVLRIAMVVMAAIGSIVVITVLNTSGADVELTR